MGTNVTDMRAQLKRTDKKTLVHAYTAAVQDFDADSKVVSSVPTPCAHACAAIFDCAALDAFA